MRADFAKCANCAGFNPMEGNDKSGSCQRLPPTTLIAPTRVMDQRGQVAPQIVSAWPPVAVDAWCLMFAPNAETLALINAHQTGAANS